MMDDDAYKAIAVDMFLRHGEAAGQIAKSRAKQHATEGETETAAMWAVVARYVAEMLV
jgi:hypothetical protein